MKRNTLRNCGLTVLLTLILVFASMGIQSKASIFASSGTASYTIRPDTKPCDQSIKYTTYNNYTKQYYTLLSYLKKLEGKGGTLTLKKGTYTITNTLYVPSNVTIVLSDGVKIVKGTKTGTTKMSASKSIFQFCSPSKSKKAGAYSKYNGDKNISLIGKGTAIIDLNYDLNAVGIMAGHNQNLTIQGITFQNMYSGHFIEMDASKKVRIKNCTFKNRKKSPKNNKEAINLDTPDKTTNGFHTVWTSYDKTPNYDVSITNCTFKDLERAVGTHKYSGGKLHTKIVLTNNKITNCDNDAIRIMNWKDVKITKNTITNVANKKAGLRAILASGLSKAVITDNTFRKVSRSIQLMAWKNTNEGSQYAIIYNNLSNQEIEQMRYNQLVDGDEYFIRFNRTYNEFVKNTDKYTLYTTK